MGWSRNHHSKNALKQYCAIKIAPTNDLFSIVGAPTEEIAGEKLDMLKEDAEKMRAKDLHELLRVWENYHRILTAEAHLKHIEFRQESRYPGFYYRTDKNFIDEKNWHCFVNSIYNEETKQWTCFKRAYVDLLDRPKLFK